MRMGAWRKSGKGRTRRRKASVEGSHLDIAAGGLCAEAGLVDSGHRHLASALVGRVRSLGEAQSYEGCVLSDTGGSNASPAEATSTLIHLSGMMALKEPRGAPDCSSTSVGEPMSRGEGGGLSHWHEKIQGRR